MRSRRDDGPKGQMKYASVVFETNQKPFRPSTDLVFKRDRFLSSNAGWVFKRDSYLFLECRLGFQERQVLVFECSYLFLECRLGIRERQVFGLRMQVGISRETGFSLGMQLLFSQMQLFFSQMQLFFCQMQLFI